MPRNATDEKDGVHVENRNKLDVHGVGDELLVRAALDGSSEAFSKLYVRHAAAVRRALSDNVHDAERQRDLVQETFTRALAKLGTLHDPGQFRPWIFQIARNVAIDDLRARSRMAWEPLDDEFQHGRASVEAGPDVVTELRALADAIHEGLAALSPRDAAALSLVVHLGFGPEEVAAALGISYGNAKVVLHRARARLRGALVQQQLLQAGAAT